MTTKATTKARSPLPILQGLLPIDPARVPIDVIAGATLAALAIPEVMGYTKIAGMPVVTGLYTILLPVLAVRHLRLVAPPRRRRRLRHRRDPGDRPRRRWARPPDRPSTSRWPASLALMCGVLLIAGAAAPARLHRQLPVAQRPDRLPDRRRHPGRDGPGRRACSGSDAGSGTTLEKFANTLRAIAAGDTSTATLAVSVAVLVTIVGLGVVNKKIPGALIAVVGSIVLSVGPRPRRHGRDDARRRSRAASRPSACRRTSSRPTTSTALLPTVISIVRGHPRPERRDVARLRDQVRRQLRGERRPRRARAAPASAPGISGTFVVNGSPTKTEMVDGAGGRSQLSPADDRRRSSSSSCCS